MSLPPTPQRAAKLAALRVGIARGGHLQPVSASCTHQDAFELTPDEKNLQRALDRVLDHCLPRQRVVILGGPRATAALLINYERMQREQETGYAMRSPADRVLASMEWSRQLREKVAASKRSEIHQVLCDLQDEP